MSVTPAAMSLMLRQPANSQSSTALTGDTPAAAISAPPAVNAPLPPMFEPSMKPEFADATWLRIQLTVLWVQYDQAELQAGPDRSLLALSSQLRDAHQALNADIQSKAIQPDRNTSHRYAATGEEYLLLAAPQVQALLPEIINTVEDVLRLANDGLREAPVDLQRPAPDTGPQASSEQRLAACRRIVKSCGLILLGIAAAAAVVAGVAFLTPLAPVWCAVAAVATLAVMLPVGGVYAWKLIETARQRLGEAVAKETAPYERGNALESVQKMAEGLLNFLRSQRRDDVGPSSKHPDASAPVPEPIEDIHLLFEAKSEPEPELREAAATETVAQTSSTDP